MDNDHSVGIVPESPASDGNDIISQIRKRRSELQKERYVDLEIPGYNSLLGARYRPVPWQEVKLIGERVERSRHPLRELYGQVDILVRACDTILVRKDGVWQPIDEDETIQFDERLAEVLGFQADTARQALLATFSNDLAVTQQHNELAEWMQVADVEADESLLGESPTAPR